jgi:hypothetical protein
VNNPDLELDLKNCAEIVAKCKSSKAYAQNLYAALCNMQWQRKEVIPILKGDLWHCSWRYAGGLAAELRGEGDYLDYYCSGMGGFDLDYDAEKAASWMVKHQYVPESEVTDEIRSDLANLGWYPVPYDD